ncbi:hypothetical protein Spa11_14250 [Botrimarina mediterranea]|uniref:Uncharacterized protein n=1 Tax=Botrimarina mediterranea TaxID=2528022 RepID=A0A518K618_9BACT|nr:hypothetical protein Spa11_14250 [Botrimarina mediterranea]
MISTPCKANAQSEPGIRDKIEPPRGSNNQLASLPVHQPYAERATEVFSENDLKGVTIHIDGAQHATGTKPNAEAKHRHAVSDRNPCGNLGGVDCSELVSDGAKH